MTCNIIPSTHHCRMCMDTWEAMCGDTDYMPDCNSCASNTRVYKLLQFVPGLFCTYALVEFDGNVQKVDITRIRNLRD